MSKRRVHYVLSTHWDREWHQPFQVFRYRLVQLLDRVIDGLLNGRLRGPFTCDGQAIILEDYLEVRPERRETVERLAREGALAIGPWYVLPDEFLVSGESLVRNIRQGRDVARQFGGIPSDAGFVCDLFGHNSQMPQILAGFGVRGGFLWRGINHVATRHVRWRGADGTELPCYKFGAVGYSTYAAQVRHAFDRDHPFDAAEAAAEFDLHLHAEAAATEVDPILLFDGADHQEWDQDYYRVLVERMEDPAYPFEIVHTTLHDYLDEMVPQAGRIATLVEGELREPGRDPSSVDGQWLIPGVLSSRVGIRLANAECQALLCQWAEPLSAFALAAVGDHLSPAHRPALADAQGFLNVAWTWLLKNHPHDSICGCSIDQVHRDMAFRFSQCRQIAEQVADDAAVTLAANVAGEVGDDELRVVVFNPLPRPLDETVELTLHIPATWNTFNEFFGFEPKPAFRLYDAAGEELPYQRLAQAMNRTRVRLYDTKFPESYRVHDVTVSLPLRLPALGYTTLTVREGPPARPTRHPMRRGLAVSERAMENDLLRVTVESNGTLTVLDKRSGERYARLLTFEDTADIGDGWFHGQAVNDETVVSTACAAQVALVHDGPMVTTFRVRTTMPVPARFEFGDLMVRSAETVDLILDSLVSLRPGSDRVEVLTTVHNAAADHRLRVLFPSGAEADTYWADSPFDAVERPIALRDDNYTYRELEVETKPQQSWTAVQGGGRGLAVVAYGLLETSVRDLPERPLALTLLRSTRRTVFTGGQPDGLLLGDWAFRYDIVPLAAPLDTVRLTELGQRLHAGLRSAQLQPRDVALHAVGASLPAEASFLTLGGRAVLTSARAVGDGLEVRLYNPTGDDVQAELRLGELAGGGARYTRATPVNLESVPVGDAVPLADGRLPVTLGPKKLVTYRLTADG